MQIPIHKSSWLEWMEARGLSDRSIENYNYYFERFDWNDVTQETVIQFINRFKGNDVAKAFLRNTFNFILLSEYPIEVHALIHKIQVPKYTGRKKKRILVVLNQDEVLTLARGMKDFRNSLMVLISFYGGLRNEELRSIKPYDFNWETWTKKKNEKGRLKIIGKGDKERVVIMPSQVMELLQAWIKSDVADKYSKDRPLFNIGERQWEKLIKKMAIEILNKDITPHTLRHSCATHLLEKKLDVMEVKEYLGHENIQTTQKYLHINKQRLGNRVAKAFI